jgi:hypothetical protein
MRTQGAQAVQSKKGDEGERVIMMFNRKAVLGAVVVCVLFSGLTLASSAGAANAWWHLNALTMPANLPPGGNGTVILTATNLGDADASGVNVPIVLRGKLPSGVTATAVAGKIGTLVGRIGLHGAVACSLASASMVECVYEGKQSSGEQSVLPQLPPYEEIEIEVEVQVEAGAKSGETVDTTIAGGEAYACEEVSETSGKYTSSVCSAEGSGNYEKELSGKRIPTISAKTPLRISGEPVRFGAENYELSAYNEDGSLDTQAGSHPFDLTTTFMLNRTDAPPYQPAMPKDLHFKLPPGLVGNPTPFPQCADVDFFKFQEFHNFCPNKAAIGVALITIFEPTFFRRVTIPEPVFNLRPATGEPARFGFAVLGGIPVVLDTSVRTGGDYGVTVSVNNISQTAPLLASQVTIWGVPGDPAHDTQRGWSCINGAFYSRIQGVGACAPLGQATPPPFLSMPTSCNGPLQTSVAIDSWQEKGSFLPDVSPSFEPALDGCNRLPFEPSISVTPDGQEASTPTGLTVGVHIPQDLLLNPSGLAESNVKDTTVALPANISLNPAAADGLESCTESQIALSADVVPSCPEASKVGTLEIRSPLLPDALTGEAYLAAQNANPFGSLVALYLVAQDPVSGTLVKFAGEVKPDPVTGQLVSTFKDTPQLPFEDLKLHFFGGSRAPMGTPASCGLYTTVASIAPWSGNEPAQASSTFDITSGPDHSACASPLPFSPELTAGATNIQAGAFTPFTMTMSRQDGNQNLDAIQLHMPPGLLGTLSNVKLCPEALANAGTCGPDSLIGHTIVSVGLGGDPFTVTGGRVYITEGYEGAPYGLSIVNPAKAGPFDLGQVVVRAKLEVDPATAAITVTTDKTGPFAVPQILDGIPLQIKHVNVTIDREGFTFNPTNCEPQKITGTLTSSNGSESALSVPFQVTNCATLKFKPQFKASTSGKTSRTNGASLNVKLSYPKAPWGSLTNVRYVKVELPKQLPSRLSTLQKACPDSVFNQNPAGCPSASRVGTARASTPIIPVPLSGPAYFVSHGGQKFPELIIVLSGYGTTVYLHGETFISKTGITSSTFQYVPDVPIGSFELKLPQGPYSALAANGNLCTTSLKMPTIFKAQNGLELRQATPIVPTGCAKHKTRHHRKHRSKKHRHHHKK